MFHARRLIRRLFSEGRLSARDHGALRGHLSECQACRAEYDQIALLLRGAAGRSPTRWELDRWEEQLGERIATIESEETPPKRRALLTKLTAVVAAAILVGLCIGVWSLAPRQHAFFGPGSVQLKGADTDLQPLVQLEVFAISTSPPNGGEVTFRSVAEGDAIRIKEYIQFRYLNHGARVRYLYLLGLDRRLEPIDYFPRPSRGHSIVIEQALRPRSVPRSIKLASRHRPGPLWIVALFSEMPLQRAEVHDTIDRLRSSGADLSRPAAFKIGPGVYPVVWRVLITD